MLDFIKDAFLLSIFDSQYTLHNRFCLIYFKFLNLSPESKNMKDLKSSFSHLYNTYINELYSYGKALGMGNEDLEDAIHDVFLHIIDRQKQSQLNIDNIKFYLFRCLKNRMISDRRKSKNLENVENIDDYSFSIKVTSLDALIEEEEKTQLSKRIENILLCLTNRQREAIYLRYMQELSYEEISVLLEITEKGSRKLMSRAIEKIRDEQIPLLLFLSFLIK